MRLDAALVRYWHLRGYQTEGRAWLEADLAGRADLPAEVVIPALLADGLLAVAQDADEVAAARLGEALALARAVADLVGEATALYLMGVSAAFADRWDLAASHGAEAYALARSLAPAPLGLGITHAYIVGDFGYAVLRTGDGARGLGAPGGEPGRAPGRR